VVGAPADERVADRREAVELVALAKHRKVDVTGARDRSLAGLLDAGDQSQQRRLAVAVATDDADPLAGEDPKRDVAQDRPAAVALADVLQVDEVAGDQPVRGA
jgi:hypothetical protein